jgi:hypothetical protein
MLLLSHLTIQLSCLLKKHVSHPPDCQGAIFAPLIFRPSVRISEKFYPALYLIVDGLSTWLLFITHIWLHILLLWLKRECIFVSDLSILRGLYDKEIIFQRLIDCSPDLLPYQHHHNFSSPGVCYWWYVCGSTGTFSGWKFSFLNFFSSTIVSVALLSVLSSVYTDNSASKKPFAKQA